MTVKEFWHLKYGQIVENPGIWGWKGKVVKREVIDECSGFIMTKSKTWDIKTGRKLLEITFDCGNGRYRYFDSSQKLYLSKLRIVK